jgi:hypothetical protein
MARGGSAPGERRGGRRKGVPNKASLKREVEIAVRSRAAGQKLGKEVMAEAMMHFRALAAKYQVGTEQPDETKFERYLKLAAAIAADLSPYESPKLQSTIIAGDKDQPINHTLHVRFV